MAAFLDATIYDCQSALGQTGYNDSIPSAGVFNVTDDLASLLSSS